MTVATGAKISQAEPTVHPLTKPSENAFNFISPGFVRQEPVVARDSQEIIGHELMLNNSSELLAGNSNEAINLIHDELLLKSLLNTNLSEITDNAPVFIRLSPASLENPILKELPPEHLILAIHPSLTKTDTHLTHCRELKSFGYHFALDDLNYSPGLYHLLGLADYLRFSINRDSAQNLNQRLDQIPRLSEKILVAKNINSPEQLQIAYQLPFLRYQGSYFGHATITTPPAGKRLHEKI
ncbi:MAG: EAL domain-containing protein [Gammaproteobacteria bacterium]|nr:EAL domain-containing protein [Gammaproteobacteria bacterium]MBU1731175.1 EAL domain-containing protein [Gammaproteobacteria bacterium]MBU1891486.1 EAL domain-containing protein [Gammaproteobacteria bacterium]